MKLSFSSIDISKNLLLIPSVAMLLLVVVGVVATVGLSHQRSVMDNMYTDIYGSHTTRTSLTSKPAVGQERFNVLGKSQIRDDKALQDMHDSATRGYYITYSIITATLLAALSLLLLLRIFIKNRVLPAIARTNEVVKGVAVGNLTTRVEVKTNDELGEMGRQINNSLDKLQETFKQFSQGSVVISGTANALDNASRQMMNCVDEVTQQINSLANASEEMSMTSSEIAKNCASASQSSELAYTTVKEGEAVVNETIVLMDHIHDVVEESANIIERLGERSNQIGGIIGIINEIAAQTNLLALNAAIEAARAGEHGRGFAVVSDEVRKLAEKTTEATTEIGDTVMAMQEEMKQAVVSMDTGVNAVAEGARDAKKSGDSLHTIISQIDIVSREIHQIASATEQQTATTTEMAANMQHISRAMEETAQSVSENARSASEMADLSGQIKKLVGAYKLVSSEEARQMVGKAFAYIKAQGKDRAIEEFNDPKGEFVKGELFIFVMDYNGIILAYGGNTALVGNNMFDAKDVQGNYISRDVIKLAKNQGNGWHEYYFKNPHTDEVQLKATYFQAVDDYYIGCGIYK